MTIRIDQGVGALALQHHAEDEFEVKDRLAVWAVRFTGNTDGGRHQSAEGTLGDVLCNTVWLPAKDGEDEDAEPKRPLPGWAAAWPAVASAWGEAEDDPKKPVTGPKDEVGKYQPIRKDDIEPDERFEEEEYATQDWMTPYPIGHRMIAIGGTEEFEQHRIAFPAEGAIIAPNHEGPGIMGTLVHDLQPYATMTREGPPGRAGRAARAQTMMRVVRPKSWDHMGELLMTKHNIVAWNCAPTGADAPKEGPDKDKAFAGLGTVYGLSAVGVGRSPQRPKGPVTPDVTVGGGGLLGDFARDIGGIGDAIRDAIESITDSEAHRQAKEEAEREEAAANIGGGAVAFADWVAAGPFITGFGQRDKHQHGPTHDAETMHPWHITTEAYFADPKDYERDAPLEFDKAEYTGGTPQAVTVPVHLRYSKLDRHFFMGDERPGLFRWETTVPYVDDGGPPSDGPPTGGPPPEEPPTTPPTGGPPTIPPPTSGGGEAPLPVPDSGGIPDNGGNNPGIPRGGDDPSIPRPPFDDGIPSTPGRGPGGVPQTGPQGEGPGAPAPSSPPPGDSEGGSRPPTQGDLDNGTNQPPYIELEDGTIVPFNEFDSDHVRRWRRGYGRQTPTGGAIAYTQEVHNTGADPTKGYITHPRANAFGDLSIRPQGRTGDRLDLRWWGATQEQVLTELSDRPTTMRIEGYGAETDGDWAYTQEPGRSRTRGGTAPGGVAVFPPEIGMDDIDDDFAPPGVTTSPAYMTFAPGACLAFGLPSQDGNLIQDGGYTAGYESSNEDVQISGLSSGTMEKIASFGVSDAGDPYSDFGSSHYMMVASGTDAERPSSPVAGTQRWSTTGNEMEWYTGSVWTSPVLQVGASVTGSRGGNVALSSLLTNLAATGIIQDNTTP